jgi:hypothetical protein
VEEDDSGPAMGEESAPGPSVAHSSGACPNYYWQI